MLWRCLRTNLSKRGWLWRRGSSKQRKLATPWRCLSSRMRISYRVSSIAVLLVFGGMFLLPASLIMRPRTLTMALVDPCAMWQQIVWLIRLSALVWFATFLSLFVQGLRNRTVPRVVAIVSFIAFCLGPVNQLWRVQHCEANLGIVVFSVWITVVGVTCVHHIIQRPVRA